MLLLFFEVTLIFSQFSWHSQIANEIFVNLWATFWQWTVIRVIHEEPDFEALSAVRTMSSYSASTGTLAFSNRLSLHDYVRVIATSMGLTLEASTLTKTSFGLAITGILTFDSLISSKPPYEWICHACIFASGFSSNFVDSFARYLSCVILAKGLQFLPVTFSIATLIGVRGNATSELTISDDRRDTPTGFSLWWKRGYVRRVTKI